MPISLSRVVLLAATAVMAFVPGRTTGQTPQPATLQDTAGTEVPRVFLDCQADGCDENYLRTELTWISFVRDRNAADVYIIVTERTTGGGGTELTALLQGQRARSAISDTLVATAPQGSTPDELRRVVARTIGQGMLRFVRDTPLGARLSISYQAPRGQAASATRGARDRWNLWVFRIGSSGFTNGDANYKYVSTSGSIRASRTTAAWKTALAFRGYYEENHVRLSDTSKVVSYQHSYNMDALQVKSLNAHWSIGAQVSAFSEYYTNIDFSLRVGPSIEYDLLPYEQSTRHQVIIRYGPGFRFLNYGDTTIFGKLAESHPDHRLVLAADIRRPWGNVGASVSLSQYLHDLSKRNLDMFASVRWRIFTGLEFNIDGGYTQVRDQIYLSKAELDDDDILIRLRQLRTGYRYFASVGLSYTFGSVFNNVVNPRFTLNNCCF
jgi:hypothetical protein